jgi:hypothetical protein
MALLPEAPLDAVYNALQDGLVLDARPAGGDYAATVACAACAGGAAAATIRDLTFGDVWYCGGQSNM